MSHVKKHLFLVLVVTACLAAIPQTVLAVSFYYTTQGEANSACQAQADYANSGTSATGAYCVHQATYTKYVCYTNPYYNCGGENAPEYHYSEACPTSEGSYYTDSSAPTSACMGGCGYTSNGTTGVSVCSSAGCLMVYVGTGDVCDGTEGVGGDAASSCTNVDGVITCDCVADPGAPFCPGGTYDAPECFYDAVSGSTACYAPDDPNMPDIPPPVEGGGTPVDDPMNSGGGDSSNTGGNSGGGDGDPDTPGANDGTGDGDTDEDGERDIDCNPLSNPDCAFSGSASAVSVCGAPPSCSGDPVQCAILMQQYNTMCAILTAAENDKTDQLANSGQASNDCDTPPVCQSSNPVECVAIRQSWENTCMLIDPGTEPTPWDGVDVDPDWGRDLAGEGEGSEVDISTGLDQSGFASGSCPAPLAVDAMGASFSIDFQPICDVAGWVRVFVIMLTLLWAAPFVIRSF